MTPVPQSSHVRVDRARILGSCMIVLGVSMSMDVVVSGPVEEQHVHVITVLTSVATIHALPLARDLTVVKRAPLLTVMRNRRSHVVTSPMISIAVYAGAGSTVWVILIASIVVW